MADNVFYFKHVAPDGDVFKIKLKPSATHGEFFSAVAQHLSTPERPVTHKDIIMSETNGSPIVTLETWKKSDAAYAANAPGITDVPVAVFKKPYSTHYVWVRHDTPGA
jgi:hypothetical protein